MRPLAGWMYMLCAWEAARSRSLCSALCFCITGSKIERLSLPSLAALASISMNWGWACLATSSRCLAISVQASGEHAPCFMVINGQGPKLNFFL